MVVVLRSSLVGLSELIKNKRGNIRDGHLKAIRNTPFGNLFMAFYDNYTLIEPKEVTKNNTLLERMIRTFDKNTKCLMFGNEKLEISVDSVALIFGLPKGGIVIPIKEPCNKKMKFIHKYFRNDDKIQKSKIATALDKCIVGHSKEDEEDFATLIALYIVATVFHADSQGTVPWYIVSYIMDSKKMKKVAWAKVFHSHLLNELEVFTEKDRQYCAGCTIHLMYLLCELVEVIEPIEARCRMTPRALRWNLNTLANAMKKQKFELVPKKFMMISELKGISEEEKELLDDKEGDDSETEQGEEDQKQQESEKEGEDQEVEREDEPIDRRTLEKVENLEKKSGFNNRTIAEEIRTLKEKVENLEKKNKEIEEERKKEVEEMLTKIHELEGDKENMNEEMRRRTKEADEREQALKNEIERLKKQHEEEPLDINLDFCDVLGGTQNEEEIEKEQLESTKDDMPDFASDITLTISELVGEAQNQNRKRKRKT